MLDVGTKMRNIGNIAFRTVSHSLLSAGSNSYCCRGINELFFSSWVDAYFEAGRLSGGYKQEKIHIGSKRKIFIHF